MAMPAASWQEQCSFMPFAIFSILTEQCGRTSPLDIGATCDAWAATPLDMGMPLAAAFIVAITIWFTPFISPRQTADPRQAGQEGTPFWRRTLYTIGGLEQGGFVFR
jgi:hypothetical protein